MLDENQISKLREMREKGLTISETAKALGISESSVKKYTSEDYEREKEFDEKAGNSLSKQFDLEGYDFQDEIVPLIYKLKGQANEINITLHDYLEDIANIMNKFLRISDKPHWFYYVFCELAKNYSLINDHIDPLKFMEAIDNFYNREISMEESENFLFETNEKSDILIENAKENYYFLENKINNIRNEAVQYINKKKIKTEGLIENAKEELNELNKQIEETKKKYEIINAVLIKKIACNIETLHETEQSDKNNEITKQEKESIKNLKQENTIMEVILKEFQTNFPVELEMIVNKVKNAIQ